MLGGVLWLGGEFAFVVFSEAAARAACWTSVTRDRLVAMVGVSMALTPLLLIAHHRACCRQCRTSATAAEAAPSTPSTDHRPQVLIAGMGRFGQIVARLLVAQRIPFVALEHRPRSRSRTCAASATSIYYGDPTRPELLRAAGGAARQGVRDRDGRPRHQHQGRAAGPAHVSERQGLRARAQPPACLAADGPGRAGVPRDCSAPAWRWARRCWWRWACRRRRRPTMPGVSARTTRNCCARSTWSTTTTRRCCRPRAKRARDLMQLFEADVERRRSGGRQPIDAARRVPAASRPSEQRTAPADVHRPDRRDVGARPLAAVRAGTAPSTRPALPRREFGGDVDEAAHHRDLARGAVERIAQVGIAAGAQQALGHAQQAVQRGQVQRAEAARILRVERAPLRRAGVRAPASTTSSSQAVPGSARAPSSSSSGVTPPAAACSGSAPASSKVSNSASRRGASRRGEAVQRGAMQRRQALRIAGLHVGAGGAAGARTGPAGPAPRPASAR